MFMELMSENGYPITFNINRIISVSPLQHNDKICRVTTSDKETHFVLEDYEKLRGAIFAWTNH